MAGLEIPTYEKPLSSDRTYTLDEARLILMASRGETKPERRWLPWLCAYSGARVNEIGKLRRSNFLTIEGVHCYRLRVDNSRDQSIKTDAGVRTIPLHSAIIAEGFLTYLEGVGDDKMLFPKNSGQNISRWLKRKVFGIDHGKPPNHAWRHLFKDLCGRYEVEDWARIAITGYSEGDVKNASDAYGGSDVRIPGIKNQLERVEPLC